MERKDILKFTYHCLNFIFNGTLRRGDCVSRSNQANFTLNFTGS